MNTPHDVTTVLLLTLLGSAATAQSLTRARVKAELAGEAGIPNDEPTPQVDARQRAADGEHPAS